jgi:hypothetical protein
VVINVYTTGLANDAAVKTITVFTTESYAGLAVNIYHHQWANQKGTLRP